MPRDDSGLESLEQWMYSVISHPQGAEAGVEANSKPGSKASYVVNKPSSSEKLTRWIASGVRACISGFIRHHCQRRIRQGRPVGSRAFAQVVRDYINPIPPRTTT